LASAARQLVHLLCRHEDGTVAKLASVAGLNWTRRELVEMFIAVQVLGGHGLDDIASTIHALESGIRLV
jgi:hypothetical protein